MSELTLSNPEQLTQIVNKLVLTATEKFELNKRMANRARQFFRQQIRKQRDIENNPYQPKRRKKGISDREALLRGMVKLEDNYFKSERHKKFNNKNMMLGFSKALRTQVTDESFSVGYKGIAGKIAREHNEGATLSFTTKVNGRFNSKTGRWEGGTKVKNNYDMPRRTFIGWTPALEQELLAMAAQHYTFEEAA